jgi:uncharacterized protein YjbI with pentapeptide repeats
VKILYRFSGAVKFECDAPTIKLTLEAAVKSSVNLRGADLRNADLGGAYLSGAYLRDADLRDADLRNANLYGADLRNANLYGADLRDADLRNANLYGADLSGANLSGADLRGADLRYAYLTGAFLEFKGATLTLIGARPVISISALGSRRDTMMAFVTDGGVFIRAGCFFDKLAKFSTAVKKTHKTNVHAKQYKAAIALIKLHAKTWCKE